LIVTANCTILDAHVCIVVYINIELEKSQRAAFIVLLFSEIHTW
jgi:hypothetical protein